MIIGLVAACKKRGQRSVTQSRCRAHNPGVVADDLFISKINKLSITPTRVARSAWKTGRVYCIVLARQLAARPPTARARNATAQNLYRKN